MVLHSLEDALFPGVDVELERVTAGPDLVLVEVAACGPAVRCPDCGGPGWPHPGVEFRQGRRQHEPGKSAQKIHVWPGIGDQQLRDRS